ncbi:MAG: ABC transporter ATP-binding protein [Syntrophomonadaceae bacterium]|nr:ABC transporter ATP-binding protein [Syntrophomonadaceae bacterium]
MIRVENLHKLYKSGNLEVGALQGISFKVDEGEFIAVMGASGSGKSTLMNLLGLLDTPTEGSYFLDGTQTDGLKEDERAWVRNQKIGFVFQSFNLLPRLTALENVEVPMVYAGIKPSERRKSAMGALERLGLAQRWWHRPHELSGGQNQRVAIARALVNNPALILADEPTGALDTHTSQEIMEIFRDLNQHGSTIVVVTHEPEIAAFTNRLLRLSDGRLIADEAVLFHPQPQSIPPERQVVKA